MKVSELVRREPSNHVTTLRLLGEWDLATAPELHAAAIEVLAEKRDVIIDLLDTEFVDSAVVHAICRACSYAADEGSECVLLVNRESAAWRVLEIAGVLSKIPNFSSEADAVLALESVAA
jgi:anti-anti-sigma factor